MAKLITVRFLLLILPYISRSNGQVSNSLSCTPTATADIGPFYKPNAPFGPATDLRNPTCVCPNSPAHDRVYINGTIRLIMPGQPCGVPVKAMLDIWHADINGIYSDIAPSCPDFRCRTRIFTTNAGEYSIVSTFPGRYTTGPAFRPAHIHFRITPVDQSAQPNAIAEVLTTQLYFAYDQFLMSDPCPNCSAGDLTLRTCLQHVSDIKTYMGTWNVLLRCQG